eukprot:352847-Chlamydomonas_euryale.AAC.2
MHTFGTRSCTAPHQPRKPQNPPLFLPGSAWRMHAHAQQPRPHRLMRPPLAVLADGLYQQHAAAAADSLLDDGPQVLVAQREHLRELPHEEVRVQVPGACQGERIKGGGKAACR